jgi:hypothetical protein
VADDVATPMKPEFFDVEGTEFRDNAAYLASVFAMLLMASPRTLVVTVEKQARRNDPDKIDTVIRAFRAGTAENAARSGKLNIYPSRDGEQFEFAPTVSADDSDF